MKEPAEVVIHKATEHDIVHVVYVHGLTQCGHPQSAIAQQLPKKDDLDDRCQMHIFAYDHAIFSKSGRHRTALSLLDMIRDKLFGMGGGAKKRRPNIVFVAHDIGGILVKHAIVVAEEQSPVYDKILLHTSRTVFLCTPNRAISVPYLSNAYHKLLSLRYPHQPDLKLSAQDWDLAQDLVHWTMSINSAFAECKFSLLYNRFNVWSNLSQEKGSIFNAYIANSTVSLEEQEAVPLPHVALPAIIADHVRVDEVGTVWNACLDPKDKESTIPHLLDLTSHSAPQYPFQTSSLLGEWLKATKTSINSRRNAFFVPTESSARTWTEGLYRTLGTKLGPNLIGTSFFFDPSHYKLYSVEYMLSTFITLLVAQAGRRGIQVKRLAQLLASRESEGAYVGWNMDDLFDICVKIITGCNEHRLSVIWVLGRLSPDIESCGWLLDRLQRLMEDHSLDLTVIVVAREGLDWDATNNLKSWANPVPDEVKASVEAGAHLTKGNLDLSVDDTRIQRWVRTEPSSGAYGLMHGLLSSGKLAHSLISPFEDLLQSCGEDLELREMIVEYIRSTGTFTTQKRLDAVFPRDRAPTREDLFRHLLSSALSDSEVPRRALLLLTYSVRPLLISELEDALALVQAKSISSSRQPPLRSMLKMTFRNLVNVSGSTAELRYPGLREFIASGQTTALPSAGEAHAAIADLCLRYITSTSSPARFQAIKKKWRHDLQNKDAHPFLRYAAQHWPSHATASTAGGSYDSPTALDFVRNRNVMKHWSRRYWALCNSLNKRIIAPGQGLAILACHGLKSLLAQALSALPTPMTPSSLHAILGATAMKADMTSFRAVLRKSVGQVSEAWDGVILASMLSGKDELVGEVIDALAPTTCDNVNLLIRRASQLGLSVAVQKLLAIASRTASDAAALQHSSALAHACSRNQADAELVTLLLDYERDRLITDKEYEDEVHINACTSAQSDIFPMLMNVAFQTLNTNNDAREPALGWYMKHAAQIGRTALVERMLQSLAHLIAPEDLHDALLNMAYRKNEKSCLALLDHHREYYTRHKKHVYLAAGRALESRLENLAVALLDLAGETDSTDYERLLGLAVEADCRETTLDRLIGIPISDCDEDERQAIQGRVLHSAAKKGRSELIRLFAARVDKSVLEQGDKTGQSLLYSAAWFREMDAVRALLDAGADVTTASPDGWQPIHAAYDDVDMIELFVEHGADPCTRAKNGTTALTLASRWGALKAVKKLLQMAPRSNTSIRQDALSSALEENAVESAKLLLDDGADPRKSPTRGFAELKQAMGLKNADMADLLLQFNVALEPPPDYPTAYGILRYALEMPKEVSLRFVKQVVRAGAVVDAVDQDGYTALYQAVDAQGMEATQFLIASGADVNASADRLGGTYLMGCFSASVDMLKLLQSNGANVGAVCGRSRGTALHAALLRDPSEEKEAVVRHLVQDIGIDVNVVSPFWGSGPLALCCLNGSSEAVRLLVDRGAEIDKSDYLGRRPVHFALYKTKELVLYMLDKGATLFGQTDILGRNPLHMAVLSGRLDLVRYILEAGDEIGRDLVNEEDADGWTPLLWALRPCVRWQHGLVPDTLEIVRELIFRGARPDVSGSDFTRSWTPWEYAEYNGLSQNVIDALKLKPKLQDSRDRSDSDDGESPRPRIGKVDSIKDFCDVCLVLLIGISYECLECVNNFAVCSKCHRFARKIHPEHELSPVGKAYEEESEASSSEDGQEDAMAANRDASEELEDGDASSGGEKDQTKAADEGGVEDEDGDSGAASEDSDSTAGED